MFILAQPDGPAGGEGKPANTAEGSRPAGETKTCAACGAGFTCFVQGASAGQTSCWCSQISIRADALARLREQYHDCLCEACLRRAAAEG